jgi:hypothetical protein
MVARLVHEVGALQWFQTKRKHGNGKTEEQLKTNIYQKGKTKGEIAETNGTPQLIYLKHKM